MSNLLDKDAKISIYVLKLEHDKYYVGQTKNLEKRLKQHLKGKLSSDWTKIHKPLSIYKSKETPFSNVDKAMHLENLTTIWCMKKFGWKNVRGGDFCTLDENKLRFLLALNSDLGIEILPVKTLIKSEIKRNTKYIFILRLSQQKYFVGCTTNIFLAIINEYNEMGAEWTKVYKPEELNSIFKIGATSKIPTRELINCFVEKNMIKYGFENVRGGDFFNIDERKHKNKVLRYTRIFDLEKQKPNNS